MYYLVCIWRLRSDWAGLRIAERRVARTALLGIIRPIRRYGVDLISAGRIASTDVLEWETRSYAIWEAASGDLIEELEQAIERSDWRCFVDYSAFSGANIELDDLLEQQVDTGL